MSISKLSSYIDTYIYDYKKHYSSRGKNKISKITIHHAAGVCTVSGFSSVLRDPDRTVSFNYGIGNDGKIGNYLDEKYRPWTTSSRENDMVAITIEVSNSSTGGNWPISDAAYKSLINLCEDICRRNNIEYIKYTGNRSGNLTMHKWFASTLCPGPYLESKFPEIANTVNTRLLGPDNLPYVYTPVTNITAYDAAILGDTKYNRSLIDQDKISPYIITLDRRSRNLDFNQLQTLGVVGVIIEAGSLYDVTHKVVNYRNPILHSQALSVTEAGLRFGLFSDVKARNTAEAIKELSELRKCILMYPPTLGMWLRLCLTRTVTTNDAILDKYCEELNRLGLKGRIGIQCTRDDLKYISWDKHKENYYLWLVDHINSTDNIQELLIPEFFESGENNGSTAKS